MSEQQIQNFKVKGEAPQAVGAAFSNFLAVSRVGTEVQFEFVFLDLNYMAVLLEQLKASAEVTTAPEVEGKTVAKVVMPAAIFVQLHEQFEKIFAAVKAELPRLPEVGNEHQTSSVG